MKSKNKKSNTDTPSLIKRPRLKTEGDWLDRQAEVAKNAIKNTAVGMIDNLIRTLKIQDWAKEYPIKTTGVAAVVGFFVGEKVTEVYEERKIPEVKVKLDSSGVKQTILPPKTSQLSELSSQIIVKGTDLLKDMIYTWFAQEVLSKNKGNIEDKKDEEESVSTDPS